MAEPRLPLAQLPTPLEFSARLTDAWGGPEIWIKRDDLTGFGVSGNKVRKLELHLAAAQQASTTALITCGAVQSNHCRATAIVAARLGLRCVLFLRSGDGSAPQQVQGNHLLQRLAGAECRFITPQGYDDRFALMEAAAADVLASGGVPWVIPEGASDRLGMLAFDHAVGELADQIDGAATLWHASSSGGTTAGLALGVARRHLPMLVVGSSVGNTVAELTARVERLLAEAGDDGRDASFEIIDDYVGLGYGRTTDDELLLQLQGTRLTGMIWDPTYTGKALYALKQEIDRGRFTSADRVVFWHTGGGFAAFAHDFSRVLA